MSDDVDRIWDAIIHELGRQQALMFAGKFSATCEEHAKRGNHAQCVAVLAEEVGEVARAINDLAPSRELRKELLQVAAVAVSWLMGISTND